MPEGIGYSVNAERKDKRVSPEKHAARKGCVEVLMERGLSREEASRRCGAGKAIDISPSKRGYKEV